MCVYLGWLGDENRGREGGRRRHRADPLGQRTDGRSGPQFHPIPSSVHPWSIYPSTIQKTHTKKPHATHHARQALDRLASYNDGPALRLVDLCFGRVPATGLRPPPAVTAQVRAEGWEGGGG